MDRVLAHRDLADVLARVERPGRYVGGEWGSATGADSAPGSSDRCLRVVVSYPDLYEIAMSNAAIRILYGRLNRLDGVVCERVFAPAPDFEAALRQRGLPLCSLESGLALSAFDLIAFSIGFELTLTNLLAILDLGGVPVRSRERTARHPVVLAGGPSSTNPGPLAPFVDAVFVGEAEGWLEQSFAALAELKRRGGGREDLLAALRADPSVWYPGRREAVRRALWRGFGRGADPAILPVPNMRVVQDHGTVEIMRGCPNACRFCHATVYYRPCRRKAPDAVLREVADAVLAGYREVTLSSLSSGDYPGIHDLVRGLNAAWSDRRVSFSLPSLRVDSLALRLLAGVSEVRKSGLTFAVETPSSDWQEALRKSVPLDKTVALLREARSLGWRSAKFYFMVGLPPAAGDDEAGPIVEFLRTVRRETAMELVVNVAAFIPKPHTPWERAPQLGEAEALEQIMRVRRSLHGAGFKIGYHAPFLSLLEGIVSRGDERAGELVLEAFRRGARLDAWEEHLREDVWRGTIADAGWDVATEACRERTRDERLPWHAIGLALSQSVPYGDAGTSPQTGSPHAIPPLAAESAVGDSTERRGDSAARMLFAFTKRGRAAWTSHLDLMVVFERALARAGLAVRFTEGFNPKPRLEFASPLSLGLESEEEVAAIDLRASPGPSAFRERLNAALPEGLSVTAAATVRESPPGKRRRSLMALYWGSEFRLEPSGRSVRLPREAPGPRKLLESDAADRPSRMVRIRTFAIGPGGAPVSYFEALASSSLS